MFQETLLALFRQGLARFRGSTEPELRSYLATIARNEVLTYLRKRKRRPDTSDPLIYRGGDEDDLGNPVAERADPSPEPDDRVSLQEILERLRSCLEELPSPDQQVVWMRARNFSYDEIARVAVEAGCPQGWEKYLGPRGRFIGMHGFGASAPYGDLYKHFGITVEAVFS